jgi:ribosomal protein L18
MKYLLLPTDNGHERNTCKQVFRTEEKRPRLNVLQYTQAVTVQLVSVNITTLVALSNKSRHIYVTATINQRCSAPSNCIRSKTH